MRLKKRTGLRGIIIGLLLFVPVLGGCAGPSTQILPREAGAASDVAKEAEVPVLEEANPFYLQETLDWLASVPRPAGSREEADAAASIKRLLQDYGYEVRLQSVSAAEGVSGSNVIAVKKGARPDADILIVGAHHDTAERSPGAGNSAAGVAALLESARLVSQLPSDTEVWFVSFTGDGTGDQGIFSFGSAIPDHARDRVIGAVNLGALGGGQDSPLVLDTESGRPTVVGDMLVQSAKTVNSDSLNYRENKGSSSRFFSGIQIPAVTLTREIPAFEAGLAQDRPGMVDVEQVAAAVDVLSQTVAQVMGTDTPSLLAKSRFQNPELDGAYVQPKEIPFLFGANRNQNELQTGRSGILVSSNLDGAGIRIDNYQYRMKWFGIDQTILTTYHYSSELLDTISLDADGAGIDFADMAERLTAFYGDPVGKSLNPNGTELNWADPVYHKFFALVPKSDSYDLEIREYQSPQRLYGLYRLDGTALEEPAGRDGRVDSLLALLKNVFLPEDQEKIAAVRIETDGVGNNVSSLQAVAQADGALPQILLSLDLEDLYREDGTIRSYSDAVICLAVEYGRLLWQDQSPQSRTFFENQFGAEAAETAFSEAFAKFVLQNRPESPGPAPDAGVQYFYEEESFVKLRRTVRGRLGLADMQEKEEYNAGEN